MEFKNILVIFLAGVTGLLFSVALFADEREISFSDESQSDVSTTQNSHTPILVLKNHEQEIRDRAQASMFRQDDIVLREFPLNHEMEGAQSTTDRVIYFSRPTLAENPVQNISHQFIFRQPLGLQDTLENEPGSESREGSAMRFRRLNVNALRQDAARNK